MYSFNGLMTIQLIELNLMPIQCYFFGALSGRLFQSLGAKYEKALPPLVDFAILGTTKSPEFCDLRERDGL